jgi:hypothetical protein
MLVDSVGTIMIRKPNSEQRRRDLCDAAIHLLATEGARGLTHLRVDRQAGFADGTTSFYYQTRSALLRGAIDRVIELDVADFTEALDATRVGEIDSLLSHLAAQWRVTSEVLCIAKYSVAQQLSSSSTYALRVIQSHGVIRHPKFPRFSLAGFFRRFAN